MPKLKCFPGAVYGIMKDCWNEEAEQRPSFAQLQEQFLQLSLKENDVSTDTVRFYLHNFHKKDRFLLAIFQQKMIINLAGIYNRNV